MDKKQLCQSYFIIFLFLIVIEGHRGLLLILYGSAYIYIINCKANGKKNHHSRILHCEIIYDHSGRNSCARISPTSQSHHFNTFTFKRTNDFAPYPSALEHCLGLGSSQPAYKISKWRLTVCDFQSLALTLEILLLCEQSPCICKCTCMARTHKETDWKTDRDRVIKRENKWAVTCIHRKMIGLRKLKSTVHSLVLQSVVWTCRLFCSFSCRHYLIFQIVTWLFAWFHQPLQTSSVKQTEQYQHQHGRRRQSQNTLPGASPFPSKSYGETKEANTAAFHNGSLLLWTNTWSLGNAVVSHVLSIAVWYCSP